LEPTRGPYRKPKNVMKKKKGLKTTRRGKNRKQTKNQKNKEDTTHLNS
jgi:predicted ATPase